MAGTGGHAHPRCARRSEGLAQAARYGNYHRPQHMIRRQDTSQQRAGGMAKKSGLQYVQGTISAGPPADLPKQEPHRAGSPKIQGSASRGSAMESAMPSMRNARDAIITAFAANHGPARVRDLHQSITATRHASRAAR